MGAADQFDQLQRDVRYLMDRQSIVDCIARHARGHDRHDVELLTSAYHPDGVDEHGYAINTGPSMLNGRMRYTPRALDCTYTTSPPTFVTSTGMWRTARAMCSWDY